ncbi:kinase-like protein [Apiospora phragmitis]|uniref:non-specific serine/threonine protein kinase n=1 Tax=Apiospora phragmitis TaxID=2905665 RepID=A0ABR1VE36_9PEZI
MSGKLSQPPSGTVEVRKSGMGELERLPISSKPLDHLYERVKTIDDGAGNLGGMNAGVYVVREKNTGQVYVQKCYQSNHNALIKLFRDEIGYMRVGMAQTNRRPIPPLIFNVHTISDVFAQRLMHSSIVQYVDAYVNFRAPFEAAAYMEYCDRGSLRDLIVNTNRPSHLKEKRTWPPLTQKPDIFLGSHDTPNSTKPLYVLLSDFGVACFEDNSNKPGTGPCSSAGTPEYHAPELCFHPAPTDHQMTQRLQASPHTGRSDLFAVVLLMYCMCERSNFPHIDPRCRPMRSPAALGRAARSPRLDISARGVYSDYLARVILWAGAREAVGAARRPEAGRGRAEAVPAMEGGPELAGAGGGDATGLGGSQEHRLNKQGGACKVVVAAAEGAKGVSACSRQELPSSGRESSVALTDDRLLRFDTISPRKRRVLDHDLKCHTSAAQIFFTVVRIPT